MKNVVYLVCRLLGVAVCLSPFVLAYYEEGVACMGVTFMLGGWLFFLVACALIVGIIHEIANIFNYQAKWLDELDVKL